MAALFVAGCGGTGTGTGITNSVFAGTYVGTWTNTLSANGPGTITVAADGTFAGTLHDNVSSTDNTVDAVIDNAGNVNGSIVIPGPTVYSFAGTLALNGSNQLTGTLNETNGGTLVTTVTVTLTKQ